MRLQRPPGPMSMLRPGSSGPACFGSKPIMARPVRSENHRPEASDRANHPRSLPDASPTQLIEPLSIQKKQRETVLASRCKLLEPLAGDGTGNGHRMPLMPRAPPRQTTARAAQARVAVAMCGVLIAASAPGARLRQPHLAPRLRHRPLGKVLPEELHTQLPAR